MADQRPATRASGVPSGTITRVTVPDHLPMLSVLGTGDELVRVLERAFDVQVLARGNDLTITGEAPDTDQAGHVVDEVLRLLDRGQAVDAAALAALVGMAKDDDVEHPSDVLADAAYSHAGRVIRPKTVGQKTYLDAIRANTVTFGIGPAGTGKTYLAMAMAVLALRRKEVSRIILTRPAVEAGERLGFLPGTLYEKIDPYLRPLFDALHDMLDAEELSLLMERGTIEVAPLAFMRGRTLNDAFIVLDEAQNTTAEQMKMFLTRIGFGSKAVVTGDVTQVDLPGERGSGLATVQGILGEIDGVAFRRLTGRDVVRHRIVQQIVEAYERHTDTADAEGAARGGG